MEKTNRKEQIKQYVDTYTENQIQAQTFNFDSCNAYIIALDLKLDRANVSRILNRLFTENKLIKIKGRPTLYISKRVIYEHFPFIDIPATLSNEKKIKKYLYPSKKNTSNYCIEIIGIEPNESLYDAFHELIPYLINPPIDNCSIIHVIGEFGSGKKYIIEQAFSYVKKRGVYSKESSIYYIFLNSKFLKLYDYIQDIDPENNPVIFIDLNEKVDSKTIATITQDLSYRYRNLKLTPPIVLYSMTEKPTDSCYPVSSTIHIPSLSNRPREEILGISLYIFLKHARKIHTNIHIDKDVLLRLLSVDYRFNNTQLEQEIYYCINQCQYMGNYTESALNITNNFLRSHYHQTECDQHKNTDLISSLPNDLTITHDMTITDIKELIGKRSKILFLQKPSEQNVNIKHILCTCTSSFNPSDYQELSNNSFEQKIKRGPFEKDPNLLHCICKLIEEYANNRISIFKYQVDNRLKISSIAKSMIKVVNHYVKSQYHLQMMEVDRFIIEHIIEEGIQLIKNTHIPALIISHGENVSESYTLKFNELAKKRLFYSLDYSKQWQDKGIKSFTNYIQQILPIIDRGKGILLFVDSYPLTTIASTLTLNSKVIVFPFSPISSWTLLNIIEHSDNTIMSYIKENNRLNMILEKTTFQFKKERDKYLNNVSSMFPMIDTSKTVNLFLKSLNIITQKLNLITTNRMVVDYIFHGNAILEKKMNPNRNYVNPEIIDTDIYDLIRDSLSQQTEFTNIHFTDFDISILYYSILNNISERGTNKDI